MTVVAKSSSTMICLSNTATPCPLRPIGIEAKIVHSSVSGSYTSVEGQPWDSKEARSITHTPPKHVQLPIVGDHLMEATSVVHFWLVLPAVGEDRRSPRTVIGCSLPSRVKNAYLFWGGRGRDAASDKQLPVEHGSFVTVLVYRVRVYKLPLVLNNVITLRRIERLIASAACDGVNILPDDADRELWSGNGHVGHA